MINAQQKQALYNDVIARISSLIENESDAISIMATVACELHSSFDYFDWTGFYRVVSLSLLKVGPYQGPHGCLVIPFERGVCGAAASSKQTQLITDVNSIQNHIACSSSTRSEIVLPVFNSKQQLVAVLDVDSDTLAAFDQVDQLNLEHVCRLIKNRVE